MKEWQCKQVFFASLLFKKVREESRLRIWDGHLFGLGGECGWLFKKIKYTNICMYIKHIHNTDFSNLWNSYNQILTVHCHCCCLFGAITIKIEWDAAVVHHLYSFTNWSCNHCIVVCSIDILITFVESILCRWVGLCTAGDIEGFIHRNSVVSEIGCHNGVYWVVV